MNTNLVKELNNLFTKYDNAYSLIQLCERCYKSGNLVLCEICRLFYHMEVWLFI